jgi:hypothetical protein
MIMHELHIIGSSGQAGTQKWQSQAQSGLDGKWRAVY